MKIIVALDSFKGSLTAIEAGEAVAEGLYQGFKDFNTSSFQATNVESELNVRVIPLSDGGEGMLDSVESVRRLERKVIRVSGPLGEPIEACYGILGDTMVIESAMACGLGLVAEEERNPMLADSGGLGTLIRYGLENDFREIIIGLGGSAVNDGGVGMLRELGYKFFDEEGYEIGKGGEEVGRISRIDDSEAVRVPDGMNIIIASDVNNPLCGKNGASEVFGAQKGATPEMRRQLDSNLRKFAGIVEAFSGQDFSSREGAGAAGGLGFAIMAFLGGKIQSGVNTILQLLDFGRILDEADLVITGEGRLDRQTLMGKAPYGVMLYANNKGIPVIAIGGSVASDAEKDLIESGFDSIVPILSYPCSLSDAMQKGVAKDNLRRTGSMILHLLLLGKKI